MKNNKGITLIVLIITILVMLILATVSISMLVGEDGVIKNAEESLTKTKKQELYEKIATGIVYNDKGKIDLKKTADYIKANFDDVEISPAEIDENTNNIAITIDKENGEQKYTISSEGIKIIEKTFSTQITPENYGDKVNYVSKNGISEWRIFYNDGTHVFLITSENMPTDKIDTDATKTKINGNAVIWDGNALYGTGTQLTAQAKLFRCG